MKRYPRVPVVRQAVATNKAGSRLVGVRLACGHVVNRPARNPTCGRPDGNTLRARRLPCRKCRLAGGGA